MLDDVVQKHKGRIAERVLANGVLPDGVEGDVLQTYADARGITLVAAATEVLTELGTTGRLLVETEQSKDRLLADIARITTLRQLRRVEKLLEGTAS